MSAPREVRVLQDFEREAADFIAGALAELQSGGKTVSLGLSGGKTPGPIYARLAQPPLRERVDWKRVAFFWADERCVPPEHPDSNYGLAKRTLLEPLGVPPEAVFRIQGELGARDAAGRYDGVLRRAAPEGLDLLLLGLGEDGHTASLFPGSRALEESTRFAVGAESPAGQPRVTLTLPFIARCREVLVLAAGADKAPAAARALASSGDIRAGSIGARERVIWLLDRSAAAAGRR